jgi:predicted AAA+ superfamily ATPase
MAVQSFIKRHILQELTEHLDQPEISLIVGPRQAGKTTLMRLLQEQRQQRGERTVFLSLDFEQDKPHFTSQEALLSKLSLELGTRRGYAFIDEIQRKDDAGLFLKGLYDRNLPHKLIVSGSGSVELKARVHESLAGRKRLFDVLPVSFAEAADFTTGYRYEGRLPELCSVEREQAARLLDAHLRFGGYPRVVTAETQAEKTRIMDEIYRSYLERDVAALLKVEKLEAFGTLVKLLASQTGQLLHFSELAAAIGVSVATVKHYLWALEHTFIVERVSPYFRNVRKELTKAPVVYFHDLGLRNYALGIFGAPLRPDEVGWLFQNVVFQLLRQDTRFSPMHLHFWRTTDKAEVDFVLEAGERLLPIEVKYGPLAKPTIPRSLRRFIEQYRPARALVVTTGDEHEVRVNGTTVQFVSFFRLGEAIADLRLASP